MQLYIPARNAFLKANPKCQCGTCWKKSEDIHHKRGRLGPLLMDQRHWMAVCRWHHEWIGSNIQAARERGWICEKGLWNTPDRS